MDRPASFSEDSDALFVPSAEEGMRIDVLLSQRFPTYSRTYFQRLIEQGAVLLNGEQVKKRICPEEGDEIEVCFQPIAGPSLTPESIPLDIVYEDDDLLAINKPPGMVVHPAPGHWSGTFVNALLAHCQNVLPGQDPVRPGIVHRLDKETSGLLLAAKTTLAHQRLVEAFSTRRIEKIYLAICCGRPVNGLIQVPLGRHPVHRKEIAPLPDGREAITEVQTLAFDAKTSLVLVRPKTGRTHQIRVHLKHIGCPVLGDSLYGHERLNQSLAPKRLLLHAYRLHFDHPITGVRLQLTAPIPEDLKTWIRHLSGSPILSP